LVVAACSSGGSGAPASSTTSTRRAATSSSTAATSTTTTAPPIAWAAVPTTGAKVVVTPTGVVVPVRRAVDAAHWVGTSPCGATVTVTGTPISGANVVLDPGHGGDETGAVGPGGTQEKVVNLAVAQDAQRDLEALGAKVVLTRTGDYRVTLATRAAISNALRPQLFLSIHHNAEPDGPSATPGTETYYQIKSAASKRLAGLVYEEVVGALAPYKVAWMADRDAGAKYRPADDGGDYYGVLRRTAGTPAALSEGAFLTNPPEETLLKTPAVQAAEAQAIARAIVRFATTSDPGSGFVTPYPRTEPAGPGGGAQGCVDPPLG
jgi:N-acetylmuramoyl-L-alanine amidase